jgi:VanZ family protein
MRPIYRNLRRAVNFLYRWLPPLLWMLGIFYFSSKPTLPQAPGPWLDAAFKKLAHVFEYSALYLLLVRAWQGHVLQRKAVDRALWTVAVYAASDELHQAFVPGRHCTLYDFMIDLAGVLLLWSLLRSRKPSGFRAGHNDLAE